MNRKGGPRTGGRVAGKPNRMSAARVEKALQEGKRLPPEDLLLVAEKSMAMVAHYEPGTPEKPNPFENEERYAYWLAQAREALKAAAPYYSPKLHAVAVAPVAAAETEVEHTMSASSARERLLELVLNAVAADQIEADQRRPSGATTPSMPKIIDVTPEPEEDPADDADGVAV